jgi:DNA-binding MarR family transcriptional regulator
MIPTMTESDRATAPDVAGDANGLGDAIAAVEREFGALFVRLRGRHRAEAFEFDPQVPQFGYLMISALARRGRMHAGALAEVLQADKSLVSRQASQLEELGLLRREQDPQDRRAMYFAITDEARRRWTELSERNQGTLRSALADWGEKDLRLFARLLHRMNEI